MKGLNDTEITDFNWKRTKDTHLFTFALSNLCLQIGNKWSSNKVLPTRNISHHRRKIFFLPLKGDANDASKSFYCLGHAGTLL